MKQLRFIYRSLVAVDVPVGRSNTEAKWAAE
jgi:hypothetical protein